MDRIAEVDGGGAQISQLVIDDWRYCYIRGDDVVAQPSGLMGDIRCLY